MSESIVQLIAGDGPLVATAIHHGHAVRPEVLEYLGVDERGRLREEDPGTGDWTVAGDTRVIGLRSRFEVDLNRPRDTAVYLRPDDAWGLPVCRVSPKPGVVERSLSAYDDFYRSMERLFEGLVARHGSFAVLDLHTYNHRRDGPNDPPADSALNPEVNIGTGTLDRAAWAPIVEAAMEGLRQFDFLGRRLDVRENVRFRGGHFARWTHARFPGSACVLAIEFKKFFMDEWTGVMDAIAQAAIGEAVTAAAGAVRQALALRGRPER